MARLLITILILLGSNAAYAASYSKPAGAPEIFLASKGVSVAVWAVQSAVGHGVGVFERGSSGEWTLCFNCLVVVETPTLDAVVNAAGGPEKYVASIVPAINQKLAEKYPGAVEPSTGTTLEKVNGALSTYGLRIVNGSPQLGK